jgi:hypothetical protein
MLRTLFVGLAAGTLMVVGFGSTTHAQGQGTVHEQGTPSSTTLDACGYFVGLQTPTATHDVTAGNDVQKHTERGTWTGVDNNYAFGPVTSLGAVSGTYQESTTTTNGVVSGTEDFTSNRGTISQQFTYPSDFSYFNVSVQATGDLSFMTSDTNGQCYAGPFPRS